MKRVITAILIMSVLATILPAQTLAEVPQTVEETETLGLNILERLPGALKDVWQNQALPLWWNMWVWTKGFWKNTLGSKVQSLWEKLWGLTGEAPPDVEGEFQKEKQEMQKDLWERFKALF